MLKIAFPTDDGTTISAHFGRAPYFMIVTLDESQAPQFEQRAKSYHGNGEQESHDHHDHNHTGMFAPLADCQVLIAGGMGQPAYDSAIAAGLTVIPIGEKSIAAALEAFRANALVADARRVHARH
jgi:predicted Fe-Mo cluster-binding NifX family protein